MPSDLCPVDDLTQDAFPFHDSQIISPFVSSDGYG